MQEVGRHPHGRDRRTQLVRDVGDEPALQPGQLAQLGDLLLNGVGHPVERRRQGREVVLAADLHPLLEPAGREPLGGGRRQPDGAHDLTRDDRRDDDQQQHEGGTGEQHRPLDQMQRRDLTAERDEVVELVARAARLNRRPEHEPGSAGAVRAGDGAVGPGLARLQGDRALEGGRDARRLDVRAVARLVRRQAGRHRQHDDVEVLLLGVRREREHDGRRGALDGAVVGARQRGELALRVLDARC